MADVEVEVEEVPDVDDAVLAVDFDSALLSALAAVLASDFESVPLDPDEAYKSLYQPPPLS